MIRHLDSQLVVYRQRHALTRATGIHRADNRPAIGPASTSGPPTDVSASLDFDPETPASENIVANPSANAPLINPFDASSSLSSQARAWAADQRPSEPVYNANAFKTLIPRLWEQMEAFARRYTVPGPMIIPEVRADLLNLLARGFSMEAVGIIIGNPATRLWAVHRAVNSYIVEEILRGGMFRGFDNYVERELNDLAHCSVTVGFPDNSLRILYRNAVQHLGKVLSEPLFAYHVNKKGHEDAMALFERIAPLIQHRIEEAWLAMADVVKAAHDLALKMFSGPYQFEYGHAAEYDVFDPTTMVDCLHVTDDLDPQVFTGPERQRFRV